MGSYWDTSCVLKLYCLESDSSYFLDALIDTETLPHVSELLETELFYALRQKEIRQETRGTSGQSLFELFRADVDRGRFVILPMGADVFGQAREIADQCYSTDSPIFLRTLDGLQLASARLSGCQTIYCTDARMRAAANLLGLKVLPAR